MWHKKFLKTFLAVAVTAGFLLSWGGPGPFAAQSPQVPVAPDPLTWQFVQPLPILSVAPRTTKPPFPGNNTINTVFGNKALTIRMCEFNSQVMPPPAPPTRVWGYIVDPTGATGCPTTTQDTYTGPVILNTRGAPSTDITFINDLGNADITKIGQPGYSSLLFWLYSVDQTLQWADPLNNETNQCAKNFDGALYPGGLTYPPPGDPCAQNYTGPIPAVVHIHGGEVPPELDGGPDAWWTSNGALKGHGYYTSTVPTDVTPSNGAIYRYPNRMEAAPIWFHDHLLGGTRLNVHAGLAGAYIISDPNLALPAGLHPYGLSYATAGPPTLDVVTIPLVIQDRMIDTNAQLFFPADSAGGVLYSPNPEHPYWVPEFFGDTILVNGKVWPYLDVEAKRYRFLFINGSNARTYRLDFSNAALMFWVIGTDGGYLDAPAMVNRLVIMPGERYEVIIDFAGLGTVAGRKILLTNTGRAPFPTGVAPGATPVSDIMQFRVKPVAAGFVDNSYNPAAVPAVPLRTGTQKIVRLADPVAGTLAPGVVAAKTRQLTLNEVLLGPVTVQDPVTGQTAAYLGGPVEILVNNTKYTGKSPRTYGDFVPITIGNNTTYYSELPQEGETEVWEIINTTVDAHPIHLHLAQFQLINRQNYNVNNYRRRYDAAFPRVAGDPACTGGVFCPGFGPPNNYNISNAAGALGGNPDITPSLGLTITPPLPEEAGWKDTVVVYPGQVTRIAVRWAPTDLPTNTAAAQRYYPFDVSGGNFQHGYVWHCHIVDHEDNEMMRPSAVTLNPSAPAPNLRPLQKGRDY